MSPDVAHQFQSMGDLPKKWLCATLPSGTCLFIVAIIVSSLLLFTVGNTHNTHPDMFDVDEIANQKSRYHLLVRAY